MVEGVLRYGNAWLYIVWGSDNMGDTGVKGMIILKVDITAAGCEVVERTKLSYKVLMVVYNIILLTLWTFSIT